MWLDASGKLHLRITERLGTWYCAEVYAVTPSGYGEYSFYVEGRVDNLDPNVVLGFFLYENDTNEIDVELSRWGNPSAANTQFVLQPGWNPLNTRRFQTTLNGDYTTWRIGWYSDRIDFSGMHGHQPSPPPSGTGIDQWTHNGVGRPVPDREKVHINLWLVDGHPPLNGQEVEVVVANFTYQ